MEVFRYHLGAMIPDLRDYDSRRARNHTRFACLVPYVGDDSA